MNRNRWSILGRLLTSSMLVISLMLGSLLTVQANEASTTIPQISSWSIQTLHEGEKYGIFPVDWYYDGTFQKPITADKWKALVEGTAAKLDMLGFNRKEENFGALSTEMTRGAIIQSLYDILARYELPEVFEMDSYDSIEYMQKKGIVRGTGNGLDLDQPGTVEQAAVLASRLVEYAYDTAQGGAKGLLWKAVHGNNTLYLLGSVHMGISEMYPMQRSIKNAFEASDSLWVEANLQSGDMESMEYFLQLMTYNDGTTLKDHVSEETYEKMQIAADKLQLPVQAFDMFKPWVVTNNLSSFTLMDSPEDLSLATFLGVDMYFIGNAYLSGKPIYELEGLKFQGDLFNNVPVEKQEEELNQVLDAILTDSIGKEGAEQLKQWQLLWAAGDLESFAQTFSESVQLVENESSQRLFGERDRNMASKLIELLESEGESTYFVVVGAGHFVMKDTIIDQLKQKGFNVQFIQ